MCQTFKFANIHKDIKSDPNQNINKIYILKFEKQ